MPGKSRHRKGKYAIQSKRSGGANLSDQQPAVTPGHKSASPPVVHTPAVKVAAPLAKPEATRYPYITSELRTIGILAGIMLIALVVLAQVLG